MSEGVAIVVDNRIRVPTSGLISEPIVRELKACAEHDNPEWRKKRAMGYSTHGVPVVIKTWGDEAGHLSMPRGAMQRVRAVLRRHGIPYRVVDRRQGGSIVVKPLRYVGDAAGHSLRDYQRTAAFEAMTKEQGIIRASTGSGKTTIALWLAACSMTNTLIILPNTKLLKQVVEAAEKLLGISGSQVGVIQADVRRLRPLTVATQQTLWSHDVDEELREFFGCVIADEAHHCAAKTFQQVVDRFPARFRFAFTADEKRRDRMEFLVYDLFGQVVHELTRQDAQASGAIVDVEVRLVLTDFEAPWYKRDQDFNRLLNEMASSERRNLTALAPALEELAAGQQVILCAHRRDHVRALDQALVARGVRSGCMLGGNVAGDVAEFDSTRAGLRSGLVRAGVGTYQALGEGIDLPAVAVGVAVTPIATNKQKFNQYRGRLCRPSPGKTHGRLYVPFDRRVFDERVLANILAWNENVKIKRAGAWVDARPLRRAIMLGA